MGGQSSEPQQTPKAQQKIHGMGQGEADEIPGHAPAWQQEEQQDHIHGVGENIVAHSSTLLPQPLGDAVYHNIAVQHGN